MGTAHIFDSMEHHTSAGSEGGIRLALASFAFLEGRKRDGVVARASANLGFGQPRLLPRSGTLHRLGYRVTSGKLSSSSSRFPHVR